MEKKKTKAKAKAKAKKKDPLVEREKLAALRVKQLITATEGLHGVVQGLNEVLAYHDDAFPASVSEWMNYIEKISLITTRTQEANVRLMCELMQTHEDIKKLVKVLIKRVGGNESIDKSIFQEAAESILVAKPRVTEEEMCRRVGIEDIRKFAPPLQKKIRDDLTDEEASALRDALRDMPPVQDGV